MATALVSIPNRDMHSLVELILLKDIDAAANLLARFLETLDPTDSFVPGVWFSSTMMGCFCQRAIQKITARFFPPRR